MPTWRHAFSARCQTLHGARQAEARRSPASFRSKKRDRVGLSALLAVAAAMGAAHAVPVQVERDLAWPALGESHDLPNPVTLAVPLAPAPTVMGGAESRTTSPSLAALSTPTRSLWDGRHPVVEGGRLRVREARASSLAGWGGAGRLVWPLGVAGLGLLGLAGWGAWRYGVRRRAQAELVTPVEMYICTQGGAEPWCMTARRPRPTDRPWSPPEGPRPRAVDQLTFDL